MNGLREWGGIIALFAVLLALAAVAFYLALPFIFPPDSVRECLKIGRNEWGFSDCMRSVAIIRKDEALCSYIADSPGWYYFSLGDSKAGKECRDDVAKYRGTTAWSMRMTPTTNDHDYLYSDYSGAAEACAVDGRVKTTTSVSKDYFGDDIADIEDFAFTGNCEAMLKAADERICENKSLGLSAYGSDSETCLENIRLAKGLPASEVCEYYSDYYYDEAECYSRYALYHDESAMCRTTDCWLAFAIQKGDPALCPEGSSTYSYDSSRKACMIYFALEKGDASYCSQLAGASSDDADQLYCRAVILAEKGS